MVVERSQWCKMVLATTSYGGKEADDCNGGMQWRDGGDWSSGSTGGER